MIALRSRLNTLVIGFALCAAQSALAQTQPASPVLVWGDQVTANLDPHIGQTGVPDQFVVINVYDTLYRYQGPEGKLVPWLATGYKVSEDRLSWTFTLRPGVKFHDGSEITADDVVYSFHRALAMNGPVIGPFRKVLKAEGVRAIDPLTVSFTLNEVYAPFFSTVPAIAIVNRRQIEANVKDGDRGTGWLSQNSAGSGAYIIRPGSFESYKVFQMTRNPNHFMGWSHNARPIETVRAQGFPETSTQVNALLKGEVSAGNSYLNPTQMDRLGRSRDIGFQEAESMRVYVIRMHNQRPPFDNINTRRCFSWAFNYEGFISAILKNVGVRNPGPLPKNMWGYPSDLVGYRYDMAKAKEACDRARAEGANLDREIEIHTIPHNSQTTDAAQMLQSDMKKLGVNIKIVPRNGSQLFASAGKIDTTPDLWTHWVSAYFLDPENWVGQMYSTRYQGSWTAGSWYQNAKVESLLQTARTELDQAKRTPMYEQAIRQIVDDAADIWVYNTVQKRPINARLRGIDFTPVGAGSEIRTMYFAEK